jgi:histidyl-tRNA synthetase
MGMASKMGIESVLIIGQKEALQGTVMMRNMETGKQSEVKQEEITKEIKTRLKED